VATDDSGKEIVIAPTCTGGTEVVFSAPLVAGA